MSHVITNAPAFMKTTQSCGPIDARAYHGREGTKLELSCSGLCSSGLLTAARDLRIRTTLGE